MARWWAGSWWLLVAGCPAGGVGGCDLVVGGLVLAAEGSAVGGVAAAPGGVAVHGGEGFGAPTHDSEALALRNDLVAFSGGWCALHDRTIPLPAVYVKSIYPAGGGAEPGGGRRAGRPTRHQRDRPPGGWQPIPSAAW
ncbi:MAG: hypothetical protein DRQ39_11320 [Gammaproteobacteria bacterium]|nr:MAG: hypothetical protein DRQ39_11320 [Gammaproteobacteria bacterium]